ncbi:integrase catalytic domain-containing protein [Nephila pilipes]|uniref:Integrase catalytic domain-containing protein n=1 Tax=Nephila pilipes TaxID=299642 RepID=A0A8X6QXH2_NEPPI|nr:integrase catalytic domain-containing protein [Nephila pilipes]
MVMYSDNFCTFKTTRKELNHFVNVLKDNELYGFIANKKVLWKFIVDRTLWWGGFYERMVKTVKGPSRKILGRSLLSFELAQHSLPWILHRKTLQSLTLLSFEELDTLLTEIENIIELLPLTYVSDGQGRSRTFNTSSLFAL